MNFLRYRRNFSEFIFFKHSEPKFIGKLLRIEFFPIIPFLFCYLNNNVIRITFEQSDMHNYIYLLFHLILMLYFEDYFEFFYKGSLNLNLID